MRLGSKETSGVSEVAEINDRGVRAFPPIRQEKGEWVGHGAGLPRTGATHSASSADLLTR
jgi:hypothetical protein